jgi:hypothetical protein
VYILEQKMSNSVINCMYFIMNFILCFSKTLLSIFVIFFCSVACNFFDMYFSSALLCHAKCISINRFSSTTARRSCA